MKSFFYLFSVLGLILLISSNVSAQDKIYLRGLKQPQLVNVVEIGLDEIKYKTLGDSTGPVLVYSILQVDKVVLSNGSVFEFKQNNSMGVADDYNGQRKNIIKVNPFSPLLGHTAFTFEHCMKPYRSYEVGLSFIGLGYSFEDYHGVPANQAGTTLRFGFKLINTPNYFTRGMRQTHILKGVYVKPEIVLSLYQTNRQNFDEGYYNTHSTIERRNVIAGAFMMNFGYQWIVSNRVAIDIYIGFGEGFCNYIHENSDPEIMHYGYSVIPDIPLAVTGGFRMGYLLK